MELDQIVCGRDACFLIENQPAGLNVNGALLHLLAICGRLAISALRRLQIDLNLAFEYDFAPPTQRFERLPDKPGTLRVDSPGVDYHKAKVAAAITLLNGTYRLVSAWKPMRLEADGKPAGGDEDVLQAVFVRVNVLSIDPEK